MGLPLPRSTFYDVPAIRTDDAEIVARITVICEEFECYGYRRVGAELRHQGIVVNGKKKVHRGIPGKAARILRKK